MQDLVDIRLRQVHSGDVGEGLAIRLVVHQIGIITTGYEVVGPEGFPATKQRRLRAMANGVVVQAPGRHTRLLGQVRMLRWNLVVQSPQQHGCRSAEVRHDVLDVWKAVRNPTRDELHDECAILHRSADCPAHLVIVDQGRAQAVEGRVIEQNRPAPVHLRVQRLELFFGARAVEHGQAHADPGHAKVVQPALDLPQGGVDMRQRQRHVCSEAIGIPMRELGEAVIADPRRLDRV